MRSTLAVLLVLSWLPGLAAAQSMAEVARKEAERREKNKKAGVKAKAYRDADLTSAGSRPAAGGVYNPSAPGAATAPEASASRGESDGADESDRRRQDEVQWRGRVAEATAKRDQAKTLHEELSKLWLAQGEVYVDDKNRVVIKGLDDLRAKIAQAKALWDAAEEALQRLHEEARRAGVPPGWLR